MGKRTAAGGEKTAVSAASRWHVVDADGQVLGRLSTRIATLLLGKYRPDWAPDRDPGEHVVVVNAARVRLTGRKLEQKVYRRHSGQPGGLKEIAAGDLLRRHPERVIEFAVAGMLPKSRLGSRMIRRLLVYRGPEHPHSGQNPLPAA